MTSTRVAREPNSRVTFEYRDFELKMMANLEDLWFTSQDEELRKLVLSLRETLERLYEEGVEYD